MPHSVKTVIESDFSLHLAQLSIVLQASIAFELTLRTVSKGFCGEVLCSDRRDCRQTVKQLQEPSLTIEDGLENLGIGCIFGVKLGFEGLWGTILFVIGISQSVVIS